MPVKHMEVPNGAHEPLCYTPKTYAPVHIQYDPGTVTCKRCLAILSRSSTTATSLKPFYTPEGEHETLPDYL